MSTPPDVLLAIHDAIAFAGSQSALAALLSVQTEQVVQAAQVSQWASGARPVPIGHCVAIERATNGTVTRMRLKPRDYWLIWPDLPSPSELVAQEG